MRNDAGPKAPKGLTRWPNARILLGNMDTTADRLLAGLEGKNLPAPLSGPRIRYTHEAMVDLIVANPWISQNEIALHFGYSVGWISQIFTSDTFQSRLAERRVEVVDPELRATIEECTKALLKQSMHILHTKLNKPADQVPNALALKAFELGARALGIGGNAPPVVQQRSLDERLEEMGSRLDKLIVAKREGVTLNGQAREITDAQTLPAEVRQP